jgi:DNA polymerase-3 subunit delta
VFAEQFLNTFKPDAPAPVYLFCPGKGPRAKVPTFEPLLADRCADRIVHATVDPSMRDFAFAAFYADESPAGQIVMDAQTLPFLSPRRVILVRNAEKYLTDSAAGAMLDYLASPNESTVLMFIAHKMDKRTKFYKACEKIDAVVECPALSRTEVTLWVRGEAAARGRTIDAEAIRGLIDRAGTHLSDVDNALTNVMNYVGDASNKLTLQDVNAACADVAEEEIWTLTDAIAVSQPGAALDSLRRLLDMGKHPDEIIGTINWLLKSAYAVGIATGDPGISSFVAQKVAPLTQKLGVAKLRAAFALCTDTQFMTRSTGVDAGLALELLVVKLAAPQPQRKSA